MNKAGKGILGVGIASIIVYGFSKLFSLSKAGDKLSLIITKVHDVNWVGGLNLLTAYLKFQIDIKLSNPTNKQFDLTFPSIKVLYNDTEVGNTIPKTQDITLPGKSERPINNIAFEIPALKMFTSLDTVNVSEMINKITLVTYINVNGLDLEFSYKLSEV